MSQLREAAIEAIRTLPDDANLDDILEELIYYAKIKEGLREADAGKLIPIEEVVAQFGFKD